MSVIRESLLAAGRRFLELIPKFSVISAGFALTIVTVLIITEVISRSLFHYSVPFAIEYSEYLILAIAVWGAAYVLSVDGHVRADILTSRLSARPRLWVDLIGCIVGLIFVVGLDILSCDDAC